MMPRARQHPFKIKRVVIRNVAIVTRDLSTAFIF
jgi:hypothetical protein